MSKGSSYGWQLETYRKSNFLSPLVGKTRSAPTFLLTSAPTSAGGKRSAVSVLSLLCKICDGRLLCRWSTPGRCQYACLVHRGGNTTTLSSFGRPSRCGPRKRRECIRDKLILCRCRLRASSKSGALDTFKYSCQSLKICLIMCVFCFTGLCSG